MAQISDQEYQDYQAYKSAVAEKNELIRLENEPSFVGKLFRSQEAGGFGHNPTNYNNQNTIGTYSGSSAPGLNMNQGSNYVPYPANTSGNQFTGNYDMGNRQSNIAGGYIAPYITPLEGVTEKNPGGLLVFDPGYKERTPIDKARTRHEEGKFIWNPKLRQQVKAEVTAADIENAQTGRVSSEDVDDPNKVTGKDGRQYDLDEYGAVKSPEYFGPDGEGISKEKYDELIAGGDMRLASEQEWHKGKWLFSRGLDKNSLSLAQYDKKLAQTKEQFDENQLIRHTASTVDSVSGKEVRFEIGASGNMVNARTGETLVHPISGEDRMWTKENWYNTSVTPDQKVSTDGYLLDAYGYPVTKIINGKKQNVYAHEIYPDLANTSTYSKQAIASLEDQIDGIETNDNSSTESEKFKKKKKDKDIDYERRSEVLLGLAGMFTTLAGSGIEF